MIGLIAARSKNNVIGKDGKIPWRIRGEQKQFKELTTGNVVIMGRKSYEEIGHPLPNRMNIIVSGTLNLSGPNIATARSLEEALRMAEGRDVFMADSAYVLSMAQQDYKHITFHFTSEF